MQGFPRLSEKRYLAQKASGNQYCRDFLKKLLSTPKISRGGMKNQVATVTVDSKFEIYCCHSSLSSHESMACKLDC